jgi:UDP-glucose 4-epimerase
MRVLVTGGAGFIGSHIVDLLVEAGHCVSIVDNLLTGKRERIHPRARFYPVDIRDKDALIGVFAGEAPEVVVHQAAQYSLRVSARDPVLDATVNILGMVNLLQCCTTFGTRKVVFASTAAIYGPVEQMPITEETPQRPVMPYGITKLAGEHYLRYWKAQHGLDYTILRYGNVYGPRQDANGESGVIAIFIGRMLRAHPVRIDWDGEQRKDYVYVRDVARANLLALTQGGGETFCIATGKGTSVNEIRQLLVGILGYGVETQPGPMQAGDVPLIVFDCQKAKERLGWQPEMGLADGLHVTLDYFRKEMGL